MIISLPDSLFDEKNRIDMTVNDAKLLAAQLLELADEANDHDIYHALINFGFKTKLSVKVTKSNTV